MEQHNQNNPAFAPTAGKDSDITAADTRAPLQHTQHDEYQYALRKKSEKKDIMTANTVAVDTPAPVPQGPRVVHLEQLNQGSGLIDCPYCHERAMTRVVEKPSLKTETAALLCCILCGVIGACIPFIYKWSPDYHHFCSKCGAHVAIQANSGAV